MQQRTRFVFALSLAACLLTLAHPAELLANSTPVVTSFPMANADAVVADNITQYTITATISDGDGYSNIRCIRFMFDYTESENVSTRGRGYVGWGVSDGDIAQYGGIWVFADATGGGRWAYRTDDWGGTTYMTPRAMSTTVTGNASGGTGSRTIVFTFTAKPIWASNPVMNDADVWVADYSTALPWQDSPYSFDVVAQPCDEYCPTPSEPILSNATGTTLDIAINPADSSVDLFAIRISPSNSGREFVQRDGSIGPREDFQTKAAWQGTTIEGLLWNATYSFSARSNNPTSGDCPSPFGPAAAVSTENTPPVIDFSQGDSFNTGVRGQCPYRQISTSTYGTLWDITIGASARGLAGGLDADTYDWRDVTSGANWGLGGGYWTTLEFLQYARDHEAFPLITANAFGGGYRDPDDGTFICQTDNPDGLAADWIRYTNIILQNYRQGDEATLTGEDLRVYNSIVEWQGKAKLPAVEEANPPTVQYWEIGNEPELGGFPGFLSSHYLGPTAYRDRYKMMSAAMLAVDPTIKIGPCLMTPTDPNTGSGTWLAALAEDAAAPLDFVAYHPYYSNIKSNWGNTDNMTGALIAYKDFLDVRADGIRSILTDRERFGVELMATEWNPMNWDAASTLQRSMAMALGIAEGCFTFAEEGLTAATFWEQPQNKLSARDMFAGLRDYMGDTLVTSSELMGLNPESLPWRLYVTKNSGDDQTIMIWGLNFQETDPVTVSLALTPCLIQSATIHRYGKPGDDVSGGDTSLMDYSGMAWTTENVTTGLNSANFSLTLDDAEATVLVLELAPTTWADFDRDGDVDLDDFGTFQGCYSGQNVAQNTPACAFARLDGDSDVDQADFARFQNCMTAPGVAADPDCAQ